MLEQKDEEYFDEDSINEIFRTMHTIKGSSAIMMYDDITAVAHKLEDVFYYLRESHPQNVPHVELVEHVLTVADFITEEMDKIQNGDEADGDSKPIIAELDKFLSKIKGENGSTSGKTEKTEQKKSSGQLKAAVLYSTCRSRKQLPLLPDIYRILSGDRTCKCSCI